MPESRLSTVVLPPAPEGGPPAELGAGEASRPGIPPTKYYICLLEIFKFP